MRHETVDRHGTRSYPTAGPDREHIVPRDGSPPYFRERLAVTVKGKAMRDVFLYEPDTKEVRLESEVPTVKFGGLFTTGNLYKGEAAATAQSGRRFVTFMTHRHLPVWVQLLDHRHRNSPYLHTAQNGREVVKATIRRTGVDRVRASGHSYAGMTLSTMASFCGEHLESMVLQDPSGIAQHDLKLGELWNKELKPAMSHFLGLDDMPDNSMQNVVRHVTDNPLLSLREVVGLRNPDMRPHLEAAKRKGIKVGLLVLGRSAIFNADTNRRVAESEGLFHLVAEVPDAYHIDPNLRPGPIVEVQNRMFDELQRLDSAA
ncbi:MAG: hypothetical protein KDB55_01040 [Mycobacterium sp.]|nr:hypothetical protein [Mycobacterium sp.]